jgi:hypothetical protein
MILIKLQGGLGNQMFQYAFGSIIAKKNRTKLVIEDSIYKNDSKKEGYTPRKFELSIFDNQYEFAKESDISLFNNLSLSHRIKKKIGLNFPKISTEVNFEFSSEIIELRSPAFVIGYFQSYKYFKGFEKYIKELFIFSVHKLSKENTNLITLLEKENTIAVHIRRGDYVSDVVTNQFHGSCSLEYYMKAISFVTSKVKESSFVFFSDDVEWVKEKFGDLPFNKMFIDNNKGEDSWIDMYLMSICCHNIIANSSFSWWAAWLNNNQNKIVIAPKNWFQAQEIDIKSLIPEKWITI